MNRLLVLLALVATLFLAAVCFELHGLNRRLDAAAARNYGQPTFAPAGSLPAFKPETDIERRERMVRDVERHSADLEYVLKHSAASKRESKTTQK